MLFMPDSSVKAAYCSRAAELSQCCNHLVEVLYEINYAVEQGMFSPSCKEQSFIFYAPTKVTEPAQVKKMSTAEHKQLKKSRKILFYNKRFGYVPLTECQPAVTDVQKQSLLNQVKNILPKLLLNLTFAPGSKIRRERRKGLTAISKFHEVYCNMNSIRFDRKSKPVQAGPLF